MVHRDLADIRKARFTQLTLAYGFPFLPMADMQQLGRNGS